MEDLQIIYAVFEDQAIRKGFGKITAEIYPSGRPAVMDLLLLGD
jgi:hypothetical protein